MARAAAHVPARVPEPRSTTSSSSTAWAATEIDSIVDIQLARLRKLLRDREPRRRADARGAHAGSASAATIRPYGARPLKRALMRYVQDPLAKRLLAGDFQPGDTIVIGAARRPAPTR